MRPRNLMPVISHRLIKLISPFGFDGEAVTTVFLAVLVAVSLLLSSLLWFTPGEGMKAAQPGLRVPVKGYAAPAQMLLPRQIVVHTGADAHRILVPGTPAFDQTWTAARQVLGQVETTEDTALATADLMALSAEPGLDLTFQTALPLSDWIWVWRGTAGRQVWPSTRRVVITLGPAPTVWLQVEGEDRWVSARITAGAQEISRAVQEVASAAAATNAAELAPVHVGRLALAPGLWVPAEGFSAVSASVARDPLNPDVLARSFFADMSIVRKIVERDGAEIYTDGGQLLRAYPTGQAEYTRPEPAASDTISQSLSESLAQTLEFVSAHGGWLVGSNLVEAGTYGGTHRLGFGLQFLGLPVVQKEPPLEVTVSDRGVVVYNRALRPPQGPPNEARPGVSAARALEAVGSTPGKSGLVTDLYLGYVRGSGTQLLPAWIVVFSSGELVPVDAVTAQVLILH